MLAPRPSVRSRHLVLGAVLTALAGAPAAQASTVTTPTSTALPAAIADGTAATPPAYGATTALSFPVSSLPSGAITDVQVNLTATHAYVGDLDVVLVAPGGSPSRTIFSRTGATTASGLGAGADLAGTYTFADGATQSWWSTASATVSTAPIPSGTYRAAEPGGAGATGASTLITPTFANATANGTWQLRVRDGSQNATGSITAASIVVRVPSQTTSTPSVTATGVGAGEPLPFQGAVVSGTPALSGTLSFDVYGPDNPSCSGSPAFTGDVPASGNVTKMATFAPTATGTYRLRLRYSGDGDNAPSTSACNAPGSTVVVSPPFVTFDTVTGQTVDASSPKTPAGRPLRNGVQSFCGLPNTPSTTGATPNPYLVLNHTNAASTPNCVRASITYPASCPSTNLFVQSYASPFTPGTLNANYLGDAGSSLGGAQSGYSVAPGQAFSDVVFQTASPSCAGFSVTWQSTRPWNSVPPTMSAAPTVGAAATAVDGTWSGSPTFGYAWRRCAADGTGCADIAGASGKSYTPTADDLGKRLAVRVSASFVDQTSVVESAPGAPVAAAPTTTPPTPPITTTPPTTTAPPTTTTPPTTSIPATTPPPPTPPRLSIGAVGQLSRSWKRGPLRAGLGTPPRNLKAGTVFSFSITRPAKLTLAFTRQLKGRRVGSKCLAATKARTKRRKCTRGLPAGSLTLQATKAGGQRVVFQGRISATRTLSPGSYALVVKASADGQTSTTEPVTFTVRK